MTTRLLIVRHGESLWNAERRLQGQADPPLSERGRQQAAAVAAALESRPLAAIYSSPLQRARDTARSIGTPHALEPQLLEGLAEVHLGAWQGCAVADLSVPMAARYEVWRRTPTALAPPGGETLEAVQARVTAAVESIVAAHTDALVVVVTHAVTGRVLLCHLLGLDLTVVPRLMLKKASLSLVRVAREGAVLEQWGDVHHLLGVRGRTSAPPRVGTEVA